MAGLLMSRGIAPRRRFRRSLGERLAERAIALAAASAIGAILLIFVFVVREALPLLWDGGADLALVAPQHYPGYDHPAYVWQPVGYPPKYGVVPLLAGSLKITALAMAISAPLSLLAAIYVAEILRPRTRALIKPVIELLAGVPSVILGFFALTFIADATQDILGCTYRLNALVAALALSLAVLPVIFTVSEDAIHGVPLALREASLAVGARRHQTIARVVLPAALPGIVASLVLGFGRAIGETMIVLMASGNAAVLDASPTSSARTLTATIAAELGESPRGGEHWRVLFLLGMILLVVTWALDTLCRVVVRRLARRLNPSEGEGP
ncbi:phosphate ABC transporter permease subunit PstC [Polyangium sp. 6x1]|uniref:phosphate ABC transporter permease subunit PstC n=1 Tax=Polyangium sp. 6x1 TaxID=3042689 RepID=UPI0024832B7F|nr:phosphate ABC transporter permease subunit PstC [Polyangium sp. 6x1]MDI1446029.1 phosphate ABC transporter permease subunit PstC [Polyangium sp. 6x1]